MIEAKIICDSISPAGIRLTTMALRYPKFIHGEFMTHRVFSRNASSSRAVPTAKLIEEVRSDALRAAPVSWGKNRPGMQAWEEFDGKEEVYPKIEWEAAAISAAEHAAAMVALGVHKQIVNRLLEPFSHINVLVTATEWDNFFGLRLHSDAQPEMRTLAEAMWKARLESTPAKLDPGSWHLPFIDWEDKIKTIEMNDSMFEIEKIRIRVSVARCARVSYTSFETGKRSTVEEDLALYDRLLGGTHIAYSSTGEYGALLHASPGEHQATPDDMPPKWLHPEQHGNFRGWRQYRKMLPGEAVAPLPKEYRV